MRLSAGKMIVYAVASLLILLFVYAAVSKLLDYQKFRVQLGQSPLLTNFAFVLAWFVPALEIIIAVLLATDRYRLTALYASFSLMVVFSAYIFFITRFASHVPCSCGGVLEKMSWDQHLIFNIVFVVMAAVAILVHPSSGKVFQKPIVA
ncbi:MAG TPA: MauE/DoxX family redox-associated membrane protein [Flavisolibacter sp.]|nr:MauE/DoxX family redox-associated membrane protein [Flavisolibacter sp.]